MSLLEQAEKIS